MIQAARCMMDGRRPIHCSTFLQIPPDAQEESSVRRLQHVAEGPADR